MQKVLGYTSVDGVAVALEAVGEEAEQELEDAVDIQYWSADLGAYNKSGLWIWEGEIDVDRERFEGEIRDLTDQEIARIRQGDSPIS